VPRPPRWAEFTPFLAFPPGVRRVIYTTNLIESMNARLRKVTRNRGQFPTEQAALKVLYLAVRNLEEFHSPNVGIRSSGWK
jgi:putative transposase